MLELVTPRTLQETQSELNFVNWGIIPYEDSLREQLDFVQKVYERKIPNTVIFCSHESIVTKGRATQESDIYAWNGPTIEVQRGGRATYHGPNQLVVYPIINLQRPLASGEVKTTGIRDYFRILESAVVRVLSDFGVKAEGRCGTKVCGNEEGLEATGVWVGSRKICSIGIGVKRWVTYHGLALNLDHDPRAFQGLNPCGFSPNTMISLEEVLGTKITRNEVIQKFKACFSEEKLFQ